MLTASPGARAPHERVGGGAKGPQPVTYSVFGGFIVNLSEVPEPGTLGMVSAGVLALVIGAERRDVYPKIH